MAWRTQALRRRRDGPVLQGVARGLINPIAMGQGRAFRVGVCWLFGALLLTLARAAQVEAQPEPPNIAFVLTDDQVRAPQNVQIQRLLKSHGLICSGPEESD